MSICVVFCYKRAESSSSSTWIVPSNLMVVAAIVSMLGNIQVDEESGVVQS